MMQWYNSGTDAMGVTNHCFPLDVRPLYEMEHKPDTDNVAKTLGLVKSRS